MPANWPTHASAARGAGEPSPWERLLAASHVRGGLTQHHSPKDAAPDFGARRRRPLVRRSQRNNRPIGRRTRRRRSPPARAGPHPAKNVQPEPSPGSTRAEPHARGGLAPPRRLCRRAAMARPGRGRHTGGVARAKRSPGKEYKTTRARRDAAASPSTMLPPAGRFSAALRSAGGSPSSPGLTAARRHAPPPLSLSSGRGAAGGWMRTSSGDARPPPTTTSPATSRSPPSRPCGLPSCPPA